MNNDSIILGIIVSERAERYGLESELAKIREELIQAKQVATGWENHSESLQAELDQAYSDLSEYRSNDIEGVEDE